MIEDIVGKLKKIKSSFSVLPRDWERELILDTYYEVMEYGLKQAIADATMRYSDRSEVASLFAYLLVKAQDIHPLPELPHYQAIAEAAKDSKAFLSCLEPKNRSWNYQPNFPDTHEGHEAMIGYILATWYPDNAIDELLSFEKNATAMIEALSILDISETQVRRDITLNMMRGYFEVNDARSSEAHLNLRELAFNGKITSNKESLEALKTAVNIIYGASQYDSYKLMSAFDKVELNPRYIDINLVPDFYFLLSGLPRHDDAGIENINSRSKEALACLVLFKDFLIKHEKDYKALIWCLLKMEPASAAQEKSELYPEGENYAARDFISMLCDGDDFGGYDAPDGKLMQIWLKSLSLEECLALKIDNDRHWLKLHEIRGEKALIQKLSTNVARDRALSADLGL